MANSEGGADVRALIAAKAFLDKVDAVTSSGAFKSVFTIADVHGCGYRGENWLKEFQELRDALDAVLALPRPQIEENAAPPPQEQLAAVCLDCGLSYEDFPMDMLLPRHQWLDIHPDEGGVLCARCIVARASKLPGALAVHAVIAIAPVAPPSATPLEALAEYAHDAWAGWMRHLYSECRRGPRTAPYGDSLVIPAEWRARWLRQMDTLYAHLSEAEKDSDRAEARKMLAIMAPIHRPDPPIPPPSTDWQPIETCPDHDAQLFYWVVTKTPAESPVDSSGKSIYGGGKPRLHRGKYGTWSALNKATHWRPMIQGPIPPSPTPEEQK